VAKNLSYLQLYIHVVEGAVTIGEHHLKAGDAVEIHQDQLADIAGSSDADSEVLIFELS